MKHSNSFMKYYLYLLTIYAFQILDGLGLGPNGPPIPPPVTFAVIPYPVHRHSPFASDTSLHYLFVASGPNDPNVAVEEKVKKPEAEIEKAESRSEKVSKCYVRR